MKRILVTGANGQLGQCIQKIGDNYPSFEFKFMDAEELDITKEELVNHFFESIELEYCINCAA